MQSMKLKIASIKIVHLSSVGRFGRMWLRASGWIITARDAAIHALETLEGIQGEGKDYG